MRVADLLTENARLRDALDAERAWADAAVASAYRALSAYTADVVPARLVLLRAQVDERVHRIDRRTR